MQRHGNRWRGAETRFGIERWCNGWSSTHGWWIKIVRDTLEQRIPASGQTTQPRVPVPGR